MLSALIHNGTSQLIQMNHVILETMRLDPALRVRSLADGPEAVRGFENEKRVVRILNGF